MDAVPILVVADLVKRFELPRSGLRGPRPVVHAVDGVSFAIGRGETLGLVGESGCGKSTIARLITRLVDTTSGRIELDGEDITHVTRARMRPRRRKLQMVFQDPYASLNPRQTAGDIVGEPLSVHGLARGSELEARVASLFKRVGLRADQMVNYPAQFSGGQRQRLAIARALVLDPGIIVADEPVSALDVSTQAQVVNLLADLQEERGLSYLFIAHDLAVVRHISRRVAVMYLGRIVEIAPAEALFSAPLHPYTRALLAAVPVPDPARRRTARAVPLGEVPSPIDPPRGCHFHPRCPLAMERCRLEAPILRDVGDGRTVACHAV
ncbi:MAG: ATP-binding cassette domain-containing protein [Proteobacteria bacterium]|nr:ATP-binding cassette domain-containing protein [Pseudomonadota bacterium]MBI3496148.1 ATP-binding cassette domain-containing protein [Pseudomonadota bacterium]